MYRKKATIEKNSYETDAEIYKNLKNDLKIKGDDLPKFLIYNGLNNSSKGTVYVGMEAPVVVSGGKEERRVEENKGNVLKKK